MGKKGFVCAALCLVLIFGSVGCKEKDGRTVNVRVNEVVHSVFYVPLYVALEKGFFGDEGLSVTMDVGQGADKSMTALISGNADIALLGTEAGIYVYNEGREDYAAAFAQLTQRAGNFLVSREPEPNFEWEALKGRTVIGGRAGGMPQMILEYVLSQKGVDPKNDVEILTNLQFTTTAGAFAGGVADYTMEFDPAAYNIEKSGGGYVVASMGVESGLVPYTVFMATDSYIKANPDTIQKFTNAIYRAQKWTNEHSAREIAEAIAGQFPENGTDELALIIDRYNKQDTWKNSPVFDKEGFELFQDIMEQGGELSKRAPYEKLVNTEFAERAVK